LFTWKWLVNYDLCMPAQARDHVCESQASHCVVLSISDTQTVIAFRSTPKLAIWRAREDAILKATRRYCALPLHHLFPHSSVYLLIGVVSDASRHQLPAASVFQPRDKNDYMSIQSSRMCRIKDPVCSGHLQHLTNLAQKIPRLPDCTLGALPLQRRYFFVYDTSDNGQHLFPELREVTH
jgi:hypothetical protein